MSVVNPVMKWTDPAWLFIRAKFGVMDSSDKQLFEIVQKMVEKDTSKPEAQFELHEVNPFIADENGNLCAEKAEMIFLSKGGKLIPKPLPILYHGTSVPHANSIMEQAKRNKGPIDERGCTNGDRSAGIYGTGNPATSQKYTAAARVLEFCGEKVRMDANRGTVFFEASDLIIPVKTFAVTNIDELTKYVKTGILARASIITKEFKALRKDPVTREVLSSCGEEELAIHVRSKIGRSI